MATYNEIVKRLRDFSTAYYPIKSFGNGDMSELVETFGLLDAEYPKMWAEDVPNTTALGEETFKFRIYMVGQVATLKEKTDTTLGEDNTNEVKSNMRQCCLDLLSYLVQDKDFSEMSTDRNVTLTSFVDKFNDKLTGWYFDLTIRQSFSFSKCIIPMDGIPSPVDPTCDPVTININAESYTSAPSGSTENIVVKDTDGTLVGTLIGGEWIVPKGGVSYPISYVRENGRYQPTSYLTYDLGWYNANTTVFDYTTEGLRPILDSSDETKLITLNAFGNLERVTNNLGGTVFDGSDGSISGYAVDNYTGLGHVLTDIYIGNNDWIGNSLAMQSYSFGGFSDYRLMSRFDVRQIMIGDGSTNVLTPYSTYSKVNFYILDSASTSSITFWRIANNYYNSASFGATNPNTNFTTVSSLAVRNHF